MTTPSEERVWMSLYSPDIPPMPKMSAYRYFRSSNASRGEEVALDFFGSSIKHSELWDMIERIAASLDAIGINEDDVITLVTVAVPESVALFYALNKIGATANTIDPRMDRESILSTAMEGGIAFPHVRGVEGGGLTLAVGCSKKGIDWAGEKVNVVVLSAIPVAVSAFYLRLMAGLSQSFAKADARESLVKAGSQQAMWKVLVKATRHNVK